MSSRSIVAASWMHELTGTRDDDRDNETVDTEDTGHDDGDNRLDDKLGLQDGDRANADTRFGSTVGCAKVTENKSGNNAHATEEESLVGVTVHYANTSNN